MIHCLGFHANSAFYSSQVRAQINIIYEKLEQTFKNSTPDDISHALEVLELISCLPMDAPPSKSYSLFCTIMQAPIPETHFQEKWKASRLAMCSAWEADKFNDVQSIIAFLDYHFELATRHDRSQDGPIQHALCTLARTPKTITIRALQQFDPTKPSFVRGISHALQGDRPAKLHEATLLFLPLICDKWFNAHSPIMDSKRMRSFCMNWASAVDNVEKTPVVQVAALTVLLGMTSSPLWNPHVIPEKWTLLEHFTSVPDDLQHLHGYINNLGLMDKIRSVDNPIAAVLWVEILWLKYAELVPEVQEQLEIVTKEIARNERGVDPGTSQSYIDKYLLSVGSELRKAEGALESHAIQSTEPIAVTLREKVQSLKEAIRLLDSIRLGRPIL